MEPRLLNHSSTTVGEQGITRLRLHLYAALASVVLPPEALLYLQAIAYADVPLQVARVLTRPTSASH